MTYVVLRSVSTLKTLDGEDVLNWEPGDEVESFPEHVSVKELLKIGAIKEADKRAKDKRPRRRTVS